MDWQESASSLARHARETAAAAAAWARNHPGRPLDLTAAQREYALSRGLPPDYYRLGPVWTRDRIREFLSGKIICPVCRGRLDFEFTPGCPRVNPHRLTGLFICPGSDCEYHFHTPTRLLDWRDLLDAGRILPGLEDR